MLVLTCTRIPLFLTHNFMNNLPTEIFNAINLLIQPPAVQSVYSWFGTAPSYCYYLSIQNHQCHLFPDHNFFASLPAIYYTFMAPPFWHHWKPRYTRQCPLQHLNFVNNTAISCKRYHSIRHRKRCIQLLVLRSTLRYLLAKTMLITLALQFVYWMTIFVSCPSRYFLLL